MSSKRQPQTVEAGDIPKKSKISETSGDVLGPKDDITTVPNVNNVIINPRLHQRIDYIRENYDKNGPPTDSFQDSLVTLHYDPFRCCELTNFIEEEEYLTELKRDLEQLKFYPKNNDLYKFHQSDDLKTVSKPTISKLRDVLYGDFRVWLEKVTGIPLNDTVDMSCSLYTSTDTLLCHDDELEGRRIAFIFYLVTDWTEENGGTLDLFNVDENGEPKDVIKVVCPQWNKFVFFEVTPVSFHQVSEVVKEGECRLAVSGWFHGPNIKRPKPYVDIQSPYEPCLTVDEQLFYRWINPMYLDIDIQCEIQSNFESESEIELPDFIKSAMYENLEEAVQNTKLIWKKKGPANKRCYHYLEADDHPAILTDCVQFFRSDAFFIVLSNLTGLSLHELAMNDDDNGENVELSEQPSSSDNNQLKTPVQPASKTNDKDTNNSTAAEKKGTSSYVVVEGVSSSIEEPTSNSDQNTTSNGKISSKKREINPRCKGEVRCWKPGCYTLLADTDIDETAEFNLDARFFIGCSDWRPECGGYTSYIVKNEDEELLSVNPVSNSLALVYRDNDTISFVKHINHTAVQQEKGHFYDISFVYRE